MTGTKQRKRNVWIGIGVVALAGLAWALRSPPVEVATAVVTRGKLVATANAEGRTRVKELYVVSAPVDGQLERVIVHPGDTIAADAKVAEISPSASRLLDPRSRAEATAAVSAAEATAARAEAAELEARAALEHAQSQLGTTRQLAEQGAAPRIELEHRGHEAEIRRQAAEGAAASARSARADLVRARAALAPASVKPGQMMSVESPVAGRILRVLRESAGPVPAGTPLLEVGNTGSLEVHADLLSSDAAKVQAGAAATITGWGGTQAIRAQVRRVDPAAFTKVSALGLEEQRVHVVLDLVEAPPAGLGHDYRVDAAVVVWEGDNVLRVPSTSLFRAGDHWAVFVVRQGRARKTVVESGATDGTLTAVTGDVKEGDTVIVQPSDAISDGTRVRGA